MQLGVSGTPQDAERKAPPTAEKPTGEPSQPTSALTTPYVHPSPVLEEETLKGTLLEPAMVPHEQTETLELRIGGRWLNRIGAVILLLSAAFLLKLSVDRGWLSATGQVLIVALFGAVLIVIGELCLRREMRIFAGGILGTGIGVLYLAGFAAHKYYGLVGQSTALVLYTLVTALSVAIAIHARMLPVAVLSLVGGYATPILLSTGKDQQVALLTYVFLLNVGFLITGTIRRWHVLRLLSWLATLALFGGWYVEYYQPAAMWRTAGFLLAFYLLFHAEIMVSLWRGWIGHPQVTRFFVHANNTAFFASTYFLLRHSIPEWMGTFAVAAAGLQWLLAWRVCGDAPIALQVKRTLWVDGAAILACAAPMQFDRYWVSVSWAVQAVATLWFCRQVPNGWWLRLKATGVWLAAILHLLLFEYEDRQLTVVVWSLGNWTFTWLLVCFVWVGICGYGCALMLRFRGGDIAFDRTLPALFIALGSALLLGIFADQWERYLASWWWIALTAIWWAVAQRVPRASYLVVALTAAVLAKFFSWDTLGAAHDGSWSGIQGIVANRAVLTGACVAALSFLIRGQVVRSSVMPEAGFLKRGDVIAALGILACVAITWTASFEVFRVFRFEAWVRDCFVAPHRAQGVFLTGVWALNAAVLWTLGAVRVTEYRGYAFILTGLCILKVMAVDTLGFALRGYWRELSGIVLNRNFLVGLLTIASSLWGYDRLRRAERGFRRENTQALETVTLLVSILTLVTWLVTFEIARVFRFEELRYGFVNPKLAMQVSLSVFWSLNAVGLLALGFLRDRAILRYYAILLFAVTVGKVFLVDLSHLDLVYRVVSFLVVGLLLMFASFLYQRLAGRIRARANATAEDTNEAA
jgi:hypothetical protein